jgi:glycosyltransferase involved in cell wall biosynthesis
MRFLAVHPNFELYGSDRSFAAAIAAIERNVPHVDITVVLPQAGPILTLPVFERVRTIFEAMWIPRRGDMTFGAIPRFLVAGAARIVRASRTIRNYDFVYIDTVISLDYIAATIFSNRKSVIHVREIPTGREMKVFRRLLLLSHSYLIFNSTATQEAFRLIPSKSAKSFVVYNGTEVPPEYAKEPLDENRPVRVLVIGRLNAWKGQEILVAAIAALPPEKRSRLDVRIVGSVFEGMDHFHEKIVDAINSSGVRSTIAMEPFKADPSDEYLWADVVVVPSIKPEPFGRVAIEAMAYGAAVVASAHGGLTEIVMDGVTGQLIPPANVRALADALLRYVDQPDLLHRHGRAGYQRFKKLFTEESSERAMVQVMNRIMAASSSKGQDNDG